MNTSKLTRVKKELGFRNGIFNGTFKKKFRNLEKDWEVIQTEVMKIIPDAKSAYETTRPLIEKVGMSIRKIQDALGRNHRTTRSTSSRGRMTKSHRSRLNRSSYSEMKKAS